MVNVYLSSPVYSSLPSWQATWNTRYAPPPDIILGWFDLTDFLIIIATMGYIYVVVTGRKRTLFHCKWANSISYISRMLYWNHSRFSVSLYEWLNSMHSKFQSHSYWQSLVIAVWTPITPPALMFIFYLLCMYVCMYVHTFAIIMRSHNNNDA